MSDAPPQGIWWLASYPKSGNTWTRAFLANLSSESDAPADINELNTGVIASSREWVENAIGHDISELNHDEVDRLRPAAYRWLAAQGESEYHKAHDAYIILPDGEPLFPRDATRGAVCLVRNPLDVVPSYANHSSIEIGKAVAQICSPTNGFCLAARRQVNQLRQQFGTWSQHVESWLDADIPKLVVRYEDMKRDPLGAFTAITRFLELEHPESAIAAAVEACRFERLRQQEDEKGFQEKSPAVKNFFRKGIVGGWREELTTEQVRQIIAANRPGMTRMGYLDANGELADELPPCRHPQAFR